MDSTAATGLPLHGIPTQSMMHPWTLCMVRSHKLPHLTMDEHAAGQLGSRPHFQVRFGHLRIQWSHAAISASLCSSSWVILVFLRVRIWFDWFDFFCASWLLWFTMGPLLSMAYRRGGIYVVGGRQLQVRSGFLHLPGPLIGCVTTALLSRALWLSDAQQRFTFFHDLHQRASLTTSTTSFFLETISAIIAALVHAPGPAMRPWKRRGRCVLITYWICSYCAVSASVHPMDPIQVVATMVPPMIVSYVWAETNRSSAPPPLLHSMDDAQRGTWVLSVAMLMLSRLAGIPASSSALSSSTEERPSDSSDRQIAEPLASSSAPSSSTTEERPSDSSDRQIAEPLASSSALSSSTEERPSDSTERECIFCMDGVPTHICIPCGHRCMCAECANIMQEDVTNGRLLCPICRATVAGVLCVFDV